jgi:hypothetical protein
MASTFQNGGVKARMIRIGSYRNAYYQRAIPAVAGMEKCS